MTLHRQTAGSVAANACKQLSSMLLLLAAVGASAQVPAPDSGATGLSTLALQRWMASHQPRPGLSLALGARTLLVYEPPLWRPQRPPEGAVPDPDAEAHLALQFRSPRADGPRNLLRVQLSGGGVMQFRPRGGGLTVRYQARF